MLDGEGEIHMRDAKGLTDSDIRWGGRASHPIPGGQDLRAVAVILHGLGVSLRINQDLPVRIDQSEAIAELSSQGFRLGVQLSAAPVRLDKQPLPEEESVAEKLSPGLFLEVFYFLLMKGEDASQRSVFRVKSFVLLRNKLIALVNPLLQIRYLLPYLLLLLLLLLQLPRLFIQ